MSPFHLVNLQLSRQYHHGEMKLLHAQQAPKVCLILFLILFMYMCCAMHHLIKIKSEVIIA